jgi:hypothetical protein
MSPYASTYGTVKFGTEVLKMQGSWGLKHYCEFFGCVMQDNTKEGKIDLLGNELFSESLKDGGGNKERMGHKVKFIMTDSTCSTKGRTASFTVDYRKGIINTHEEVFLLGVNRGVIEHPSNLIYQYKDIKWKGKGEALKALENDPKLQKEVLEEIQVRDRKGIFEEKEIVNNELSEEFMEIENG